MYDMFTALLLVDHFSGRTRPADRKTGQVQDLESPWSRVFAWHRRNTRQ
jgi:hypothetical protein